MDTISLTTTIILIVIVLHLVLGFAWLVYKLSPRKKESERVEDTNDEVGIV